MKQQKNLGEGWGFLERLQLAYIYFFEKCQNLSFNFYRWRAVCGSHAVNATSCNGKTSNASLIFFFLAVFSQANDMPEKHKIHLKCKKAKVKIADLFKTGCCYFMPCTLDTKALLKFCETIVKYGDGASHTLQYFSKELNHSYIRCHLKIQNKTQ